MKTKFNPNRFSIGYDIKFYYLCIALIFCSCFANAQVVRPKRVRKTATTVNAATNVQTQSARNMEEFQNTPQHAKRKADLDKYSPGPKVKQVKFQDGSVIHVRLAKRAPANGLSGPVKKKVGEPKKERGNKKIAMMMIHSQKVTRDKRVGKMPVKSDCIISADKRSETIDPP